MKQNSAVPDVVPDVAAPLVTGDLLPSGVRVSASAAADPGRAWHFGEFYGLRALPDDRPLLVVHGNCQAESVRRLLQDAPASPCASVRIPAVHEIEPDEVPLLQRLLAQAAVLISQPIGDGYHDLPLGTAQVAAAAPRARVVVFPVFRYAALHPWQRADHHPAGHPPVVPYHDIRTLLRAAGEQLPAVVAPTPQALRAVSQWSLEQLRRREADAGAVRVSDLVAGGGADATNTIDHPGNPVLVGLARRLQEALGWPVEAVDPGLVLLASVLTPVEPQVLDALGVEGTARPAWVLDGVEVDPAEVEARQCEWLEQQPAVLADLLARARPQIDLLSTAA